MKLLKKTLIIASTLALGFTLGGCGKKSAAVNKRYIYKDKANNEYKNVTNQLSVRVKSYSRLTNRLYYYVTTNDETIIYDALCNKEIYRTTDKVSSISRYINDRVLVVTFDDDHNSKLVVATDGTILAEKGNYYTLRIRSLKEELDRKKSNYRETIFGIYTKKIGEDAKASFYKLTTLGVKSAVSGRMIEDPNISYKLESITEKDATFLKKGDTFPKSEKNYDYDIDNGEISFYDDDTNRVIASIKTTAEYKEVFMFKDKALVQVANETGASDNYDIAFGESFLNVKTYKVDLKSGNYKEIKSKYYLISAYTNEIYTDFNQENFEYLAFHDVFEIKNKTIGAISEICMDNNLNVVQASTTLDFDSTTYYDLNNGYYATTNGSYLRLVDKNGNIKKMFTGTARVLYDSKLIMLYDGSVDELKFLDFKGNYVSEKNLKYVNYIQYVSDTQIYYTDADDLKLHLITLGDGKIVKNEAVDYTVNSGSSVRVTTADKDGKNIFYSTNEYYFTAKGIDNDNDEVFDSYTITYYSTDGKQFATDSKLLTTNLYSTTYFDGYTCYISVNTKDKVTTGLNTDYILQFDLITK